LQPAIDGAPPLPGRAGHEGPETVAKLLPTLLHGTTRPMTSQYMQYHVLPQDLPAPDLTDARMAIIQPDSYQLTG
jgi:hypothetical protein